MRAAWTYSVTDAEWEEWRVIAIKAAMSKLNNTSLGATEYADWAIEKLLKVEKRPVNVEAWLRLVIKHMWIDRYRKLKKFKRLAFDELSDADFEQNAFSKFSGLSLSSEAAQRSEVERVLSILDSKEYQLIMMSHLGFSKDEIAEELGYKTDKVVATRIIQVRKKIVAAIGENPLKYR